MEMKPLSPDQWDTFMIMLIIGALGSISPLHGFLYILDINNPDPLVMMFGTLLIGIGLGGWVVDTDILK